LAHDVMRMHVHDLVRQDAGELGLVGDCRRSARAWTYT